MRDDGTGSLIRDPLPRTSPDRRAGNYYRSAAHDGQGKDGKAIGGIPLDSAEAAVVAAVRMAYKVAEVQIDRSARLARRLREAGDQAAGPGSDRQALDATEHLVFRAMMALLEWIETAAADTGSPLKRLAAAQYRLLGSFLGLTPPHAKDNQEARPPDTAPARAEGRGSGAYSGEGPPRVSVRIQHVGKERRAVRICAWEYEGGAGADTTIAVTFYNVDGNSREGLDADIIIGAHRSVTLKLATSISMAGGRWRAALCNPDGLQIGLIEIML